MTSIRSISSYLTRPPHIAGLVYVAFITIACLTALYALTDIVEQYRVRNASLEMLSRLEGRRQSASGGGAHNNAPPPGSPFLNGQTATVASATLLQRLTSIVANTGGTVVSSEMVQGPQSKDGYVTAITNCELEQDALQKVLYDIEAGLPFLFVDQLVVQPSSAPGENGKLRVTLGVTAQWSGAK
jgi:general secretion pathway protein M